MIKKLPALAAAIPLAVGQSIRSARSAFGAQCQNADVCSSRCRDERQSHGDLAYHLEHGLLHRFSMRTYGKELSSCL